MRHYSKSVPLLENSFSKNDIFKTTLFGEFFRKLNFETILLTALVPNMQPTFHVEDELWHVRVRDSKRRSVKLSGPAT